MDSSRSPGFSRKYLGSLWCATDVDFFLYQVQHHRCMDDHLAWVDCILSIRGRKKKEMTIGVSVAVIPHLAQLVYMNTEQLQFHRLPILFVIHIVYSQIYIYTEPGLHDLLILHSLLLCSQAAEFCYHMPLVESSSHLE